MTMTKAVVEEVETSTPINLKNLKVSGFRFYDDFEGTSIKNQWYTGGVGTPSYTFQNEIGGIIVIATTTTFDDYSKLSLDKQIFSVSKNPIWTFRSKIPAFSTADGRTTHLMDLLYDGNNFIRFYYALVSSVPKFVVQCKSAGSFTEYSMDGDTNYHVWQLKISTAKVEIYKDGTKQGEITTNITSQLLSFRTFLQCKYAEEPATLNLDYIEIVQDR